MKLINMEYGIELELQEDYISVVTIEHTDTLVRFITELKSQAEGGEGNFVLSENNKVLKIEKTMTVITDLFSITLNDKKIISNLYSEMEQILLDKYDQKWNAINSQIVESLDHLAGDIEYPVCFDCDLKVTGIFKNYNVKIEEEEMSFLQKIEQYIILLNKLCKIRIVGLVDINNYLNKQQIEALYKDLLYHKILVLVIRHCQSEKLEMERHCLIDKDHCLLYY